MSAVLAVEAASIRFGGVQALQEASLRVEAGEFVGLIGPNGAGKTTLLRVITGILRRFGPRAAARRRCDPSVDRDARAPGARAHAPDRAAISAHDGARQCRAGGRLSPHIEPAARVVQRVARERDRARHGDPRQGRARWQRAQARDALPLGQLKRLEFARALALEPSVLLLDEPLAGLNHTEALQQADTIAAVNAEGTTVILVEHNLEQVIRVCRRIAVSMPARSSATARRRR